MLRNRSLLSQADSVSPPTQFCNLSLLQIRTVVGSCKICVLKIIQNSRHADVSAGVLQALSVCHIHLATSGLLNGVQRLTVPHQCPVH